MGEIISKIVEYYPQIGGYTLIGFLLGWLIYKILAAFNHIELRFNQLDHKMDLLGERMATKEDLNAVKTKVSVIEEKVDVLWKRQLRLDGGLDYGLPIVHDQDR